MPGQNILECIWLMQIFWIFPPKLTDANVSNFPAKIDANVSNFPAKIDRCNFFGFSRQNWPMQMLILKEKYLKIQLNEFNIEQKLFLSSNFWCGQTNMNHFYEFGHALLCYLSWTQMFNKLLSMVHTTRRWRKICTANWGRFVEQKLMLSFSFRCYQMHRQLRCVCWTSKYDLSSTTKCDPNHICDNNEFCHT